MSMGGGLNSNYFLGQGIFKFKMPSYALTQYNEQQAVFNLYNPVTSTTMDLE
jgi:hypothetical protein